MTGGWTSKDILRLLKKAGLVIPRRRSRATADEGGRARADGEAEDEEPEMEDMVDDVEAEIRELEDLDSEILAGIDGEELARMWLERGQDVGKDGGPTRHDVLLGVSF